MQPAASHTSIVSDDQSFSGVRPPNFCQSMQTQTPYHPRIRLKKVIFRKDLLEKKSPDQAEVNVEDYQITQDGRIIDGAAGKVFRRKDRIPFHSDGEVKNKILKEDKVDDSYDCFGIYVASLLRSMQPHQAFALQADIVNLIVETQTKNM